MAKRKATSKKKKNDNKKSRTGSFAEITEYKGNAVIRLHRNKEDKFPFSFGLKKAILIVQHIKEIEDFVDENAETDDLK